MNIKGIFSILSALMGFSGFLNQFAQAAPSLPALILEVKGEQFTPQTITKKISLTSEFLAKLETHRVECAIKNPGGWEFLYFQLSKNQVTWKGRAYKADIMQSAENLREDAPRAVQIATFVRDIAVKVSARYLSMSVVSNELTPMNVTDDAVAEVEFVSVEAFEGMGRGTLLCAYYLMQP